MAFGADIPAVTRDPREAGPIFFAKFHHFLLTQKVYCYRLILVDSHRPKEERYMDDLKLCDSDYRFMSVVWES